jgi:hypothetical protein
MESEVSGKSTETAEGESTGGEDALCVRREIFWSYANISQTPSSPPSVII